MDTASKLPRTMTLFHKPLFKPSATGISLKQLKPVPQIYIPFETPTLKTCRSEKRIDRGLPPLATLCHSASSNMISSSPSPVPFLLNIPMPKRLMFRKDDEFRKLVKQKIKLNTCRLSTKELLPIKRISE